MNGYVCTEIAEFQIVSGIAEEDFCSIVDYLEENFHKKQDGFIDTELVKMNENSRWLMIQHWKSMDQSKEASKKMMKEPVTEDFRRSIDPKTIKIRYLDHVNFWSLSKR